MHPRTSDYSTPRLDTRTARIALLCLLVVSLIVSTAPPVLAAPIVTTGGPFSYTEQEPPIDIGDGISISGGAGYDGQWVDFEVEDATSFESLSLAEVGSPATGSGVVSVVGGVVYLGDGSAAEAIGNVDSVFNGQNGTKLRVNFTSPFVNPGFEDPDNGELGWTSMEQWINLGVTEIAGFTSQDTSTYPTGPTGAEPFPWSTPNEDNDQPLSATYVVETTTDGNPTEGTTALRLRSNMTTAGGCDVVHGPAVYSSEFAASSGDSIYFDWRAFAGSDAYHVFGYIVDEAGNQTEVLDAYTTNTSGSTNWVTKETVIPADGIYRFVFVAGTFDATCGQAAGAQLLIDNVQVFGDKVDDSAVTALGWGLRYENTSDDPDTVRTVNVTARDSDGATGSDQITINITPVDDAPSVDDAAASYTNTAADDDFADSTGTISATDPESDPITFLLADSQPSDLGGYDQMVVGSYGTLHVDSSDGDYVYLPDDTVINALQADASETFDLSVDANGLTDTAVFTVTIDVPPTEPGAPTGLVATAGNGQVELSWNAPVWTPGSPVSDYVVEYSDDGGSTWHTFNDGVSAATNTTVTGLTNGVEYDFRVSAINATGTSDPSNEASATPKASQSTLVIQASDFTYGDSTAWSVSGGSGSGTVTVVVVDGPCEISGNTLISTGAGDCQIQASKAADAAYHSATSATVTVTISPRALTVLGTGVTAKVYDGTRDAQLHGATPQGALPGDTVNLAGHHQGTFARPTAGTGIPVTTQMTLVGADAANYVLVQPTVTGEILPAPQVMANSDQETTYDGGDTMTVAVCNLLPGSRATASLGDTHLGSYIVDQDGCIEALVFLPRDVADGNHTIDIAGTDLSGADTTVEYAFEVLSESVLDVVAETLPFTGAQLGSALGLAFLLLFAGGIVLGLARFDSRLARRFG